MPRKRTSKGEAHRAEQERYREKLRQRRSPEASRVDIAVAAAVAVAFARLREKGESDPALEGIISDSKMILSYRGYAPNEAVKKLRGRVLFRSDLDSLKAVTTKPPEGRSSPHYFTFENRRSGVVSGSDGGAT